MYKLALKIATQAHHGQFRKDGRTPYIIHPVRVAERFKDDYMKTLSVLHDVLEDSDQDLSMFPKEVTDVLKILTRKGDYLSYIQRIAKNKIATQIKIADIIDNLTDDCFKIPESQIKRYKKALKILI